jgi:hypothetical protein
MAWPLAEGSAGQPAERDQLQDKGNGEQQGQTKAGQENLGGEFAEDRGSATVVAASPATGIETASSRMPATNTRAAMTLTACTARLSSSAASDAAILEREVQLACSHALLTCLDREHRVAYVLGEFFDVDSHEGGYICDVPQTVVPRAQPGSRVLEPQVRAGQPRRGVSLLEARTATSNAAGVEGRDRHEPDPRLHGRGRDRR